MRGNFSFTHREDAERFQSNEGGIIHDNTHSSHEWTDNHYTVHIDDDNANDGPIEGYNHASDDDDE